MLQNVLLFVTCSAVVATVAAALVAMRAAATCSKLSSALSRTTKDWTACVGALAEIRETQSALGDRLQNLQSRVGMREIRNRKREEELDSDSTSPGWKERMRQKYFPDMVPKAKAE